MAEREVSRARLLDYVRTTARLSNYRSKRLISYIPMDRYSAHYQPNIDRREPIFLFADSQLLFWRESGRLLLERVVGDRMPDQLKAAYIGASNGDNPDFYAIFVSAMEGVGVIDCRMIPSVVSEADVAFLNQADIVLLAGGDVEAGWRVF